MTGIDAVLSVYLRKTNGASAPQIAGVPKIACLCVFFCCNDYIYICVENKFEMQEINNTCREIYI